MQARSVICLVVDRLQAAAIGAYGNTWIRTPEIDRLASEAFLFDRAVTDTLDLAGVYRGFWQGTPAVWPAGAGPGAEGPAGAESARSEADRLSLPAVAAAAGLKTVLLSDDPAIDALGAAAGFNERTLLEAPTATAAAEAIEWSHAAQFVAQACELLAAARAPLFLWLHTSGLAGLWDAPYELREQYADEEDPPPPRFVEPPCRLLPDDFDPDELLGISHAYAGQVSLWDTCLGVLAGALRASALAESALLVLLAPRGFPLGEHGRVGPVDTALYNEHVQIPWLLRFPDGLGATARSQALVMPADLPATIADWLGLAGQPFSAAGHSLLPLVRWQQQAVRQCVVLRSGQHDWALRTPAWHLYAAPGQQGTQRVELYAKPSDRCEVNDIADRAPDAVAGLLDVLAKAQAEPTVEPADLDAVLLEEAD